MLLRLQSMLPSEPAFHGHCHLSAPTVRPGLPLCKEIAGLFDYSPICDREVAVAKSDKPTESSRSLGMLASGSHTFLML